MVARRYLSDVLALPDQSVSVSPGVPAGPLPTR